MVHIEMINQLKNNQKITKHFFLFICSTVKLNREFLFTNKFNLILFITDITISIYSYVVAKINEFNIKLEQKKDKINLKMGEQNEIAITIIVHYEHCTPYTVSKYKLTSTNQL